MKLLIKISLVLLIFSSAFSQTKTEIDSALHTYVKIRNAELFFSPHEIEVEKCGFGLGNRIFTNLNLLSKEEEQLFLQLFSRPVLDTSIISPRGYFRIHFDTSGNKIPDYSVTDLAKAFDSVYVFEHNYLGYPIKDFDNGGPDDLYDIYIDNLGNFYGETRFEEPISGNRFYSYMVVDNDFSGFYTTGIEAAKVTAAHEYFHVIQVGDYLYRDSDTFFFELSSTAMEEFVFDSVNDYYGYMLSYFNFPDKAFAKNNGYNLAIWNIFLKDKFGFDILKKQWELMVNNRALIAINTSLLQLNSSFNDALNEFGIWTYYTNYRTKTDEYFEESANYPLIKYLTEVSVNGNSKTVSLSAKPTSNNFIKFNIQTPGGIDSLVVMVSNSNYVAGVDSITMSYSFVYSVYNYEEKGSVKLNENLDYYAKFQAVQPVFWLTTEILNNVLLREGAHILQDDDIVFPSPFKYSVNSFIFIPVKVSSDSMVDFNIYSSSMDLIFNDTVEPDNLYGKNVIRWNARNNYNEKLGTGVYIYVIKIGDNIKKGKLVIFNE